MQLLAQELRKKFPPLGSTNDKKARDIPVIAKFFNPCGPGTWYAVEFDGEDLFWGLANILEPELGYFSLAELIALRVGPGKKLGIERDLYLESMTLADAMRKEGMPYTEENTGHE